MKKFIHILAILFTLLIMWDWLNTPMTNTAWFEAIIFAVILLSQALSIKE